MMKTAIKLTLIMCLMLLANSAFAHKLTSDDVRNIVIAHAEKEARNYLGKECKIEVSVVRMPFNGLEVKSGRRPEIRVSSNFNRFMSRDIKRVVIKDGAETLASFPVNVSVLVFRDVLVAAEDLRPFEVLTEANTQL
jgi:flagella basal body P-ring formation protein FlgA